MADEYTWTAGQKVFEPSRGWSGCPGRVLTIDRVTPSGRAVVGSRTHDRHGTCIGDRYGYRIVPLTDEHLADLALWERRMEAVRLADRVGWRDLSAEHLDLALPVLRQIAEAA